jgi:hypothetical protein
VLRVIFLIESLFSESYEYQSSNILRLSFNFTQALLTHNFKQRRYSVQFQTTDGQLISN